MEVKQIYELMNGVTNEVLGKTDVVNEDLSNIVDVGNDILSNTSVDNYVKSLVNQIGKIIFNNRTYSGSAPTVLMDSWEYGSVLEKISAELPTATENQSWELVDGQDYSPNVFYKPKVSTKFFNKKVTFEIDLSFTEHQVKESFNNANQLNGFISMLKNSVEKAMTVKIDSLIMRTINNMTAETIYSDYGTAALNSKTGVKAINLYYLWKQFIGFTDSEGNVINDVDEEITEDDLNQLFDNPIVDGNGNEITVATASNVNQAMFNQSFIRFAVRTIMVYADRLSKMSTLFNVGGKERFTPKDKLSIVMLSDFKTATDTYLNANTFNEQYVKLPAKIETVPYWQGTGKDYSLDAISSINVKTSSGHDVNAAKILAVMFDKESIGVTNLNRRVTTNYNAKAEFFNNFYKFDAGYFNDLNENFVVFFVA